MGRERVRRRRAASMHAPRASYHGLGIRSPPSPRHHTSLRVPMSNTLSPFARPNSLYPGPRPHRHHSLEQMEALLKMKGAEAAEDAAAPKPKEDLCPCKKKKKKKKCKPTPPPCGGGGDDAPAEEAAAAEAAQ